MMKPSDAWKTCPTCGKQFTRHDGNANKLPEAWTQFAKREHCSRECYRFQALTPPTADETGTDEPAATLRREIGIQLQRLMLGQKLSVAALHKLSGVPARTIHETRRGKHLIRLDTLAMLCSALGITPQQFFNGIPSWRKQAAMSH